MRRLAMALGLALTLLVGCGDDDHHGPAPAPTPTPTPVVGEEESPFDLGLALDLGQLCLQSYQMLDDFEDGTTFTLPAPYTLQQQFLTAEHFPGESFPRAVPIAFVATSGNAIYVVFRGTKTISEWISDATLTQEAYPPVSDGGKTETGFTAVYESVAAPIIDEVNALAASSSFTTLYVTGHSLGAALATLAAPELARATRFDAPVLYNFASPRVGNPTFAALVDDLPTSWRIANTNDEVPRLPPAITVVFNGDKPESSSTSTSTASTRSPSGRRSTTSTTSRRITRCATTTRRSASRRPTRPPASNRQSASTTATPAEPARTASN